ncbi:MAG: hypothetical protein J5J00_14400 [Deltaproteobacteria bacterium]|nr:hypothetical protein [Deltaproteobacteria bacterium]
MKRHLLPLLVFAASLLAVFPGILSGKILHNCVYLYHFEPWSHHKNLIGEGLENPIVSDSVDGADANLTPTNVKLFSLAEHLQFNKVLYGTLENFIFWPTALSITYWVTFALCFFSIFGFLTLWGVPYALSLAFAVGFTFGATNNHYYGYAAVTAMGVSCFWFLEGLIRNRSVLWLLLLTLGLINLGGAEMVHVIAFYSIAIFMYALCRIWIESKHRAELVKLVGLAFLLSLIISADYIYPTAYHYLFNFEKGYREEYGIRQSSPIAFATMFFSRIFGDPILEQRRWPGGTFLTTSLFLGSLAAFSLIALLVPRRWPKRLLPLLGFFMLFAVISAFYQYSFPFENIEYILAETPPFKWVAPTYFKPIFQFFLIVLAALSLTSLLDAKLTFFHKILLFALIVLGAGGSVAIFWEYYNLKPDSEWTLNHYYTSLTVGIVSLNAFAALLIPKKAVRSAAGVALVVITIAEAHLHTKGWFPKTDPSACYPETEVTNFLLEQGAAEARVQSIGRAAVPATISRQSYGIETAAGRMPVSEGLAALLREADPMAYTQHPTQYLFQESTLLDHPVWDILNVRFFIARKSFTEPEAQRFRESSELNFHHLSDGTVIERMKESRPLTFATSFLPAESVAEMQALFDSGFDWNGTAVVPTDGLSAFQSIAAASDAKIQIYNVKKELNKVTYEVSQTTAGLWIASER